MTLRRAMTFGRHPSFPNVMAGTSMRVAQASALPCVLFALSAVPSPAPADVRAYQSHAQTTETGGSAELSHLDAPSPARFSRDQWGLSDTEWSRYQSLMQGIRGSVSPAHLSPIEVLGIHARDANERSEYAKRWAKLMKEDAERVLAFQGAYSQAWRELDPGGRFVEAANRLGRVATQPLRPGDRLLLFVRLRDCAKCDALLRNALGARSRANARLDIYVVGDAGDKDIREWAARNRIERAAVQARRITLNHEHGELAQVLGVAATAPALVKLVDGGATALDGEALR